MIRCSVERATFATPPQTMDDNISTVSTISDYLVVEPENVAESEHSESDDSEFHIVPEENEYRIDRYSYHNDRYTRDQSTHQTSEDPDSLSEDESISGEKPAQEILDQDFDDNLTCGDDSSEDEDEVDELDDEGYDKFSDVQDSEPQDHIDDQLSEGNDSNDEGLPRTDCLIEAVKDDMQHLVSDLVDRSSRLTIYCGLLKALFMGREAIARKIIDHTRFEELRELTEMVRMGTIHALEHEDVVQRADIQLEVTPLMLASLKNQYVLVRQLMAKGESIEEPHPSSCDCRECLDHPDELKQAKVRLNTYHSLCSDAYIVLASEDPIFRAFELGQKMLSLANNEKHYKNQYTQLAERCSKLSSRLMDHVKTDSELDIVLNEKSGSGLTSYGTLARLKLALRNQEREFVAHPACQNKLTSLWMQSIPSAWVDGATRSMVFLVCLTLVYPLLVVAYWIYPKRKLARFMQTPMIKFAANTSSYLVLMALVLTISLEEHVSSGHRLSEDVDIGPLYTTYVTNASDMQNTSYVDVKDVFLRTHDITVAVLLLSVYIIGLIWECFKKIVNEGLMYFTDNYFNFLNFFQLVLYVISFGYRYAAVVKVNQAIDYFSADPGWIALQNNETAANDWLYWLDADRSSWDPDDLTMISEAVFAVGSILTITKLTYVFMVSERIGPLVLTLAHMLSDVLSFMLLFTFIIVAFVVGFHNLYWYFYNGIPRVEGEDLPSEFADIEEVISLFFWSIFGLGKFDAAASFRTALEGMTIQVMGSVMFAVYNWLMVIILVNMLIGMMSRTYTLLADRQDIEWKFARTKLFMEYMREGSTLAPPFNLVPTWKSLCAINYKFADDWCYRMAGRIPPHQQRMEEDDLDDEQQNKRKATKDFKFIGGKIDNLGPGRKYKKVMSKVTQRFVGHVGDDGNAEGIELLQLDLSSMHKELIQNSLRHHDERQTMSHKIRQLENRVLQSRATFTRQHAHLKAVNEYRVKQLNENLESIDEKMKRLMDSVSDMLQEFEDKFENQINNVRSTLSQSVGRVEGAITDMHTNVEMQNSKVSDVQGTLFQQMSDVGLMHSTIGNLMTNISTFRSTLTQRIELGDLESSIISGSYDETF